ncbi:MAG TPA: response regulator [Candidatus Acidoferrales bacterium]
MPRILVADDNTNIQKMVVLAFQERGIEVITVGNGEAAVRRLPDANPDLVLADVFMPVRNGYEVCEFVKKDPRFSHVPVILLVGAFDPLDEKEARRVGADGVLKKPFVPPDPLIAMVMSALEKNPKVAAELAKAKEVAAQALMPPALPEAPRKVEPKPLPDFPEPTAEEAAVIYGFGKGLRANDLDEAEEQAEEKTPKARKNAKSSKDSNAPKAPAAPRTPVAAASGDETDEDEFDDSATANDWRRNAADFEVPENVAADPIYSYGQDFKPITFPSERDVPPRRRRPEESASEESAAHKTVAKVDAPAAAQKPAADPLPAPVLASTEPAAQSLPWDVKDQPEIELAAGFSRFEEPDTQAKYSEAELAQAQPEKPAAAPPAAQHLEADPESSTARPTLVSRMRGWMDMLTPSSPDASASTSVGDGDDTSAGHSTGTADNHWMTNLPAPPAARESAPVAQSHSAPASAAPSFDQAAETQPIIEATAFAATEAPAPAAPNEDFAPTANSEVHVDDKPRQSSESAQSNDKFGGSPYHFSGDAHSETRDAVIDEFHESIQSASAQQASSDYSASATISEGLNAEAESDAQPEPVISSAADFSPAPSCDASADVLHAPADVPLNGGGLSGMLPAEPLFGGAPLYDAGDYSPRDEVEAPPQADPREQQAFAEDTHPGQLPQPAPNEEYWDREAAAHEAAILAQSGTSLFAESAAEPPALHSFDRIPTLPPPNREALSEIPFLMPPVLPLQTSEQPAARATDAEAVDNMVRKVMEKLGPHLQELLSQGVRPLVENLLQNELDKKER